MSDSYFVVPPDSTGKKIKTSLVGDVHTQVVTVENLDAKASDIKAALDLIFGQLDATTSTLAKESGGNLAAAKTDLDTLVVQVDAKTSTLAKESGGNLANIKTNTDKLDVALSTVAKETGGNLATLAGKDFAKESGGNLAAIKAKTDNLDAALSTLKSDLDTIQGQLDNKTSTLAKEADGNLAAIKTKTDNLDAKLSDIKSKTDNLDAKLSDMMTSIDAITTQLDSKTSVLAKESSGNLAAIKGKTDNLDAKLSDIKSKTDNLDVTLSTRLKPSDFPLPVNVADPTVSTQKLQVDSLGDLHASVDDLCLSIRLLLQSITRPPWFQPATGSLRVDPSYGTATIASLTQIHGYDAQQTLLSFLMLDQWANSVRMRIT